MKTKIALILSTKNRIELSKLTLDNIFTFAGAPFDLFWSDDNSCDKTKEWMSSLNPSGFCASIIKASYSESKGKAVRSNYILRNIYTHNYSHYSVIDNDILLPVNWLKSSCEVLANFSDVGICGVLVEPKLMYAYPKAFHANSHYIDTTLMGGACMVWGHRVRDEVGVFCEDYGTYGHEDADFTYRSRLAGLKTVFIKDIGIHLGIEDNTNEYKASKNKRAELSREQLFQNVRRYQNDQQSILIR